MYFCFTFLIISLSIRKNVLTNLSVQWMCVCWLGDCNQIFQIYTFCLPEIHLNEKRISVFYKFVKPKFLIKETYYENLMNKSSNTFRNVYQSLYLVRAHRSWFGAVKLLWVLKKSMLEGTQVSLLIFLTILMRFEVLLAASLQKDS